MIGSAPAPVATGPPDAAFLALAAANKRQTSLPPTLQPISSSSLLPSSPFSPPLIEQLYSFFFLEAILRLSWIPYSLALVHYYSPSAFVTICHGNDETSISLCCYATLAGAMQPSTRSRFPRLFTLILVLILTDNFRRVRSRLYQIPYARAFHYRPDKHLLRCNETKSKLELESV